jgi:hypothetical protein
MIAIISEEQLREGKRQLQRHKALTQRKFRRGDLKNFISAAQRSEEPLPILKRLFFFLREYLGFDLWLFFLHLFLSLFLMIGWITGNDGKSDVSSESLREPVEGPVLKEPTPLAGNLEKKGGFSLSGSGWKDMYAEIRAPCFLHFYKDKMSADKNRLNDPSRSNDPNVHIVDVKVIIDIRVSDKRGTKDQTELELQLGTDSIKLK